MKSISFCKKIVAVISVVLGMIVFWIVQVNINGACRHAPDYYLCKLAVFFGSKDCSALPRIDKTDLLIDDDLYWFRKQSEEYRQCAADKHERLMTCIVPLPVAEFVRKKISERTGEDFLELNVPCPLDSTPLLEFAIYDQPVSVFSTPDECVRRCDLQIKKGDDGCHSNQLLPPIHFTITGSFSKRIPDCYSIVTPDGTTGWISPEYTEKKYRRYASKEESPRKSYTQEIGSRKIEIKWVDSLPLYGKLDDCLRCADVTAVDGECGKFIIDKVPEGEIVRVTERFRRIEDGMPCLLMHRESGSKGWGMGLGKDDKY